MTDHVRRLAGAAVWLLGSATVLSGCVERREHISITTQGTVTFEVTMRSDSQADLFEGDAVPTAAAGWACEQKSAKDAEGRETFELYAIASFPQGTTLPGNFAARSDSRADLYLQFPTTLKIETRSDGTYYHFRRVYPARPWVQFEKLRERLIEQPLKSAALDGEPSTWTTDQRMAVVKAMANFECEKMLIFARKAYLEAAPRSPQDGWLRVSDDLRQFVSTMDYPSLARLLEPQPTQRERDRANDMFEAESKRFEAAVFQRLRAALQNQAGLGGSQVEVVVASYERSKKYFEVTQDLGDDKFEITLDMPGTIIATNAENAATATSSATWKFDGQIMRDQDFELLATSRVTRR
jgi:hypothetical protein